MPLLGRTTRIRNIHKGKFHESISGNVENRQSTQNEKTRQKAGFKGLHGRYWRSVEQKMVPEAGIEPARPYERGILSPMRLPVSPFGRQRVLQGWEYIDPGASMQGCGAAFLNHRTGEKAC